MGSLCAAVVLGDNCRLEERYMGRKVAAWGDCTGWLWGQNCNLGRLQEVRDGSRVLWKGCIGAAAAMEIYLGTDK